jgi:hypothetical protein
MFTIFLKSGIITKKPSTEIEANNYDKTASWECKKNQVVSIEFLCTLKYNSNQIKWPNI